MAACTRTAAGRMACGPLARIDRPMAGGLVVKEYQGWCGRPKDYR
jgi:hypothetical protein